MKIAFFHNLPKGGARRVAEEQIKRLRKKHEVDVFVVMSSPPGCAAGATPPRGCSGWKADFFKFYTLRRVHQKLAEEIDKKGYDVILVHPSSYTQAPYLLRYLKTPSVYYLHEPLRIGYEYNLRFQEKVVLVKRIYERFKRALLKKIDFENTSSATKILVNSYHTKEAVIKIYGIFPTVCYPGVDTDNFRPLPRVKKEGILFVARPSRMTGFDFLKQAVSLIEPMPQIKIIKGCLSEKQLVKAYSEAILTVCTSQVEPFGLVPLESIACQTPVVAIKEGGYRESVIDDVTGFLIERDPKLFAEKINLLLKESRLVEKMGRAGRIYVKKEWSWERHLQCLEKALRSLL